jgi:hypothetical protein
MSYRAVAAKTQLSLELLDSWNLNPSLNVALLLTIFSLFLNVGLSGAEV